MLSQAEMAEYAWTVGFFHAGTGGAPGKIERQKL
jgi:hypothetical protein